MVYCKRNCSFRSPVLIGFWRQINFDLFLFFFQELQLIRSRPKVLVIATMMRSLLYRGWGPSPSPISPKLSTRITSRIRRRPISSTPSFCINRSEVGKEVRVRNFRPSWSLTAFLKFLRPPETDFRPIPNFQCRNRYGLMSCNLSPSNI